MHVADVTEMHQGTEPMQSINEINDICAEINESPTKKSLSKEALALIPLNSPFMFHKDFYPKPRIKLLMQSCQMSPHNN